MLNCFSHWDSFFLPLILKRLTRCSSAGTVCTHPCCESWRIPRLHEYCPWTGELAYQPFTRCDARNDTSAGHALHHILGVPCYKVAIVDDVFLTFYKLFVTGCRQSLTSANLCFIGGKWLTSFLKIAPKLEIHINPAPETLYTNKPSPENIALLNP